MLSQYLAQYLLNNNLLSVKQVREILEDEQKHRVKLGVLAMNRGWMTAEQVERVHELQVRADQKLGEIAVNEGFLTSEQVELLLTTQESGNMNFGQAIIDKKFMTLAELEKVLAEYNKDNQLEVTKAVEKIEITEIDFSELEGIQEIYADYVDLFLRSLLRFMDTTSLIVTEQQPLDAKGKYLISQHMSGDLSIATGLLLPTGALIEMARRYSEEDLTEIDEFAIDCVSEFLNVTNGLYIVNLSNKKIDVDLEPQKYGKGVLPVGHKQAVVNINTNFGMIQLILAVDDLQ